MFPSRRTIAMLAVVLLGLAAAVLLLGAVQSDRRDWLLIRNTILLAVQTCALSLPVGTLLALLIFRTDLPGRSVAVLAIAAMLFVPLYVQAAGWHATFVQLAWYTTGDGDLVRPLLNDWRAVVWIHGMTAVPWVVLIVGVGVRWVEPELEEEALLFGSAWRVFTRVTLVRAAASLCVAALWVSVKTAGEMTVTDMYNVRTYAEELYIGFSLGDTLREASFGAVPGAVLIGWLCLAAFVAAAYVAPAEASSWPRPPWTFRLGPWRWAAMIVVLLLLLAIVGVPLGNLIFKAGIEVEQVGQAKERIWSLSKFWRIIATTPGRFRQEFIWTMGIGSVAATVAVLVGTPLAWWARRGKRRSLPALVVAAACLAIPGPLLGVWLIGLLNRPESDLLAWFYSRTILAPVLAMVARSLPIVILAGWYSLRSISSDELDSAATEGAGPLVRFWQIAAPQRWLGLLVCWLIALAVSVGDLAATILVVPPGVDLLSVRIFGLIHSGVDDRLAGLCLVTAAGFSLISAVGISLWRGWAQWLAPVPGQVG